MKFPDLHIIREVENSTKIGDYKTLLLCYLDWSNLDSYKKSKHISWIYSVANTSNEYEKKALDRFIDGYDWIEYNYPSCYKEVYEEFQLIKIPKNYYDEIEYFKNLSLKNSTRKRKFDPIVHEKCLQPSIESINVFFYLINDCILMYNHELRDRRNFEIIKILWLYRFWKHQTAVTKVLKRSIDAIETDDKQYFKKLRSDLIRNNTPENFEHLSNLIAERAISIKREEAIDNIVKDK